MFNLFERMETHTELTTDSTGWRGNDDSSYPDGDDYDYEFHNDDDGDDDDNARRSQSVMPGGGGSLNPLSRR